MRKHRTGHDAKKKPLSPNPTGRSENGFPWIELFLLSDALKNHCGKKTERGQFQTNVPRNNATRASD
jgi:hypothetical protein